MALPTSQGSWELCRVEKARMKNFVASDIPNITLTAPLNKSFHPRQRAFQPE